MSLSQTVTYDDAGQLVFDSSKIEVVSGKAQLKLAYSGIEDFSEDFADDTGFTYDNTKAEITGGQIQNKDKSPSGSVIGSVMDSKDLNWNKSGSTVGVLNGIPTFSLGKMVCTGSQGTSWQKSAAPVETIKFKYTPTYTTSPPVNVNLAGTYNGASNVDRIEFFNSPSGNNIRCNAYSNSGSLVVSGTFGGWSPTSGQEYEFEFVIDSTAGTIRCFIDGVLIGTLSPGVWSRGAATIGYYLGANSVIYNRSEGSFDDLIIFENAQHSSGYTPGYSVIENIYEESVSTLPVFTYSGPGLLRAAGIPTSSEGGSPRYIIQGKYWDGAAWSDSSDTYATATSKADIVTNIGTFPSTGASSIIVKVALPEGNTQAYVSQLDFSVQGELYPTDDPDVKSSTYVQLDGITSFVATYEETGSDEVKFILERYNAIGGAGTGYYWDGAAWSVSDGTLAQANTAADILANAASFDLDSGYYMRVCVLLHSDDGTTTPSITSSTLWYSFFVDETDIVKCIVYGWLTDPDGTPIEGTVQFKNTDPFFHYGKLMPVAETTVSTDANGYWEAEIVETETINLSPYDVKIEYTDDVAKPAKYSEVQVPNQDSVNFEDIAV